MRLKASKVTELRMPAGAIQTYRRLVGYLRPHRGMFSLGIAVQAFNSMYAGELEQLDEEDVPSGMFH